MNEESTEIDLSWGLSPHPLVRVVEVFPADPIKLQALLNEAMRLNLHILRIENKGTEFFRSWIVMFVNRAGRDFFFDTGQGPFTAEELVIPKKPVKDEGAQ